MEKGKSRTTLQVDAQTGWSVAGVHEVNEGDIDDLQFELGKIGGQWGSVKSTYRRSHETSVYETTITFRELSPTEAGNVRSAVEQIILQTPAHRWYSFLFRPRTFAIAWPSVGLLLLGFAILRQRRENVAA